MTLPLDALSLPQGLFWVFELCYAGGMQKAEHAPFLSSPASIILPVSQSWSELGMVLRPSLTPWGGDAVDTTLPTSELRRSPGKFCQLRVLERVKS